MNRFERLLILSPSFSKVSALVDGAKEIAKEVIANETGQSYTRDFILDRVNALKPDALIVGTERITEDMIKSFASVKAIGKYGVGFDNVDLAALARADIYFGWTPGANRRCVAELVLGFMIGHFRNLLRSVDQMQNATWHKNGGVQLSNRTVGIVGFGHIGQEVAILLQPFGCELLAHDIVDKSEVANKLNVRMLPYDDLIKHSDVVTYHVPGGQGTQHLFSESQIGKSKSGLFVINTSRASVVDFAAVTDAVRVGRLGGFAADVFFDHNQHLWDQPSRYRKRHAGAFSRVFFWDAFF